MAEVPARQLRNDTAGVLRRVRNGENITITVRGEPAAELVPVRSRPTSWVPRDRVMRMLREAQADAGLRSDLSILAGDTTDDLDPIA